MEQMNDNPLSELEGLKQKYNEAQKHLDNQEILNESLLKSALQTHAGYFTRRRKVVMIGCPILAAAVLVVMNLLHVPALYQIISLLMLATIMFFELWLTRDLRQKVVENCDLLTLARNMRTIRTSYIYFVVLMELTLIVLLFCITAEILHMAPINGNNYFSDHAMLFYWLSCGICILVGILLCWSFLRHCSNIMKRVQEQLCETQAERLKRNSLGYRIIAIIALVLFILTAVFKLNHAAGGTLLMLVGGLFLFIAVVLLLINFVRRNRGPFYYTIPFFLFCSVLTALVLYLAMAFVNRLPPFFH